jgi:hypothetical protein
VSSSTPQATRAYSDFWNDVRAGTVTAVIQDGETLQVTAGANKYTVIVPNQITGDVFNDMQKAAAAGGKTLPDGGTQSGNASQLSVTSGGG